MIKLCYSAVHVYVVIHFCVSMWSFWVKWICAGLLCFVYCSRRFNNHEGWLWSHLPVLARYIFEPHIPSHELIPLHIWVYPKPRADSATYLCISQAMSWSRNILEYISSQELIPRHIWDPKPWADPATNVSIFHAKSWSRYIFVYIPNHELDFQRHKSWSFSYVQ